MSPTSRCFATAVAFVAVVTASCGQPDEPVVRSAAEQPVALQTETTVADTTAAEVTVADTTVAATTATLPGEPFDPPFTPAGAEMDVIGVAFDETLQIHALPGSGEPVVASLPPLSGGVISEGRARLIADAGIWLEVTASGTTGWARLNQFSYLGPARDVTARVVADVGQTPSAPTMLELGEIVNEVLVPSDPAAPPAEVIVASAPASAPVSEVVYDVFPGEFFGDDTSIGFRIVVTGEQIIPPAAFRAAALYELVRADIIAFCDRGVTADGLCV